MAGESVRKIRKFKDKIAKLNQNKDEMNAQFDEALRQVTEVKHGHISLSTIPETTRTNINFCPGNPTSTEYLQKHSCNNLR